MKNTKETSKGIPVIAVIAAVCIMGLVVVSGNAFANILPDSQSSATVSNTKAPAAKAVVKATTLTTHAITTPKAISTDTNSSATTSSHDKNGAIANGSYITEAEAKAIALAELKGGTIKELHLEYDDGTVEWEGEIYLDNVKYEFDINAVTGKILEWESDAEDSSDDSDDDSAEDSDKDKSKHKDSVHVEDDSHDGEDD